MKTPLRLINARSKLFEEFQSPGPRYAILSHTWGTQEISYIDWIKFTSRRLNFPASHTGYQKILGTCSQALQDGLEYVWIDTCCIDKSNNSELDEAIRSMYNWYSNAEVCYALLSDVNHGTQLFPPEQRAPPRNKARSVMPTDAVPRAGHAGIAAMRSSRWFTRGWTLQELVAPRMVHFFGSSWTCLGSLRQPSLAGIVAEITGIDQALLLRQKALTVYSAAQKLSWAAHRVTFRGEDMAYSLMGILNVIMEPIYGEGGTQAFKRLQEHILISSDDLSVLAWPHGSATRPSQLLATSPFDFRRCGGTFPFMLDDGANRTELWKTNLGFRGTNLVVEAFSADRTLRKFVLLACHPAGAPGHVLALPVRDGIAPKPALYYVSPQPSSSDPSRVGRLASLKVSECQPSAVDCTVAFG